MRDGVIPMPGLGTRPCPICVARRRRSLAGHAGPAAGMLAAPDCACQQLPQAEQRARLMTPGAGPIATVETMRFPDPGLWVAVARGADARCFGAMADLALGLGIDDTASGARLRAMGEALERYGASVVPKGVGRSVPVSGADGKPAGRVDPARVWLPFHRAGRPVLPARSDGLAFGFDRARTMQAAAREWIERRALRRLTDQQGPAVLPLPAASDGAWSGRMLSARAFLVPAPLPVCLVLIPAPDRPLDPPLAAGAACRDSLPKARRAALREALLGWLIASGAVLPGAGLRATELLGPLAALPLADWPAISGACADRRPAPASFNASGLAFADLTPADIGRAGGHVLRALDPQE